MSFEEIDRLRNSVGAFSNGRPGRETLERIVESSDRRDRRGHNGSRFNASAAWSPSAIREMLGKSITIDLVSREPICSKRPRSELNRCGRRQPNGKSAGPNRDTESEPTLGHLIPGLMSDFRGRRSRAIKITVPRQTRALEAIPAIVSPGGAANESVSADGFSAFLGNAIGRCERPLGAASGGYQLRPSRSEAVPIRSRRRHATRR